MASMRALRWECAGYADRLREPGGQCGWGRGYEGENTRKWGQIPQDLVGQYKSFGSSCERNGELLWGFEQETI